MTVYSIVNYILKVAKMIDIMDSFL